MTISIINDADDTFVPRNIPGLYWVPALQELWRFLLEDSNPLHIQIWQVRLDGQQYHKVGLIAELRHLPHARFGGNLAWQLEYERTYLNPRYSGIWQAASHLVRLRTEGNDGWLDDYVRMWSLTQHVNAQTAEKQVERLMRGVLRQPRIA